MNVPVFNLDGSEAGDVALPAVFSTPIRPDLIHRVYVSQRSHSKQPQGTDPEAGEKTSAQSWGVGRGVARIPRMKGERHPRAGQAAGAASIVGGRVPHPPRAEKNIYQRINKKERLLATASAIAASAKRDLVLKRGHRLTTNTSCPLVASDEIEELSKARDLRSALVKLGLAEELSRVSRGRKTNSGISALRGRVTKTPRGPLLVVAKNRGISKAADGVLGVECVLAKDLSVLHLAPGNHIGRLTVWSKSSLDQLSPSLVRRVESIAV
ncbi:MAG: 50S ribosomal protein L4 [Thaumarchaeota archaeon]|nr:50S ribosomal protein L4 [Nitrososphaerota archaeon]